jgi:hypothetical protein
MDELKNDFTSQEILRLLQQHYLDPFLSFSQLASYCLALILLAASKNAGLASYGRSQKLQTKQLIATEASWHVHIHVRTGASSHTPYKV